MSTKATRAFDRALEKFDEVLTGASDDYPYPPNKFDYEFEIGANGLEPGAVKRKLKNELRADAQALSKKLQRLKVAIDTLEERLDPYIEEQLQTIEGFELS